MKHHIYIVILIFALVFSGCTKKNPYATSPLNHDISITIHRFDQDFNQLKFALNDSSIHELEYQYHEFFRIYNQGVIRIGDSQDSYYKIYANRFLTDSMYMEVYDTVQQHFPQLSSLEEDLSLAFRHYNSLFPQRQIPAVYTHISGFNTPIVVGDSILSISLENYLGENHVFYKRLGTYNYIIPHKNPLRISADAMRGWIMSEFPEKDSKKNLLNRIINEGKWLFIQNLTQPNEAPEHLIGLSKENYLWCQKNEAQLWKFMIEKQHLFSTEQLTISKYIQDGPFFNFWGSGSSPMVGKYIGWQIVTAYMKNNRDINIETLLQTTNGQEILQTSGYKP